MWSVVYWVSRPSSFSRLATIGSQYERSAHYWGFERTNCANTCSCSLPSTPTWRSRDRIFLGIGRFLQRYVIRHVRWWANSHIRHIFPDIESCSIRAEVPRSTRATWWTKDQWSAMGSVRSHSRRHRMGNHHCKYVSSRRYIHTKYVVC